MKTPLLIAFFFLCGIALATPPLEGNSNNVPKVIKLKEGNFVAIRFVIDEFNVQHFVTEALAHDGDKLYVYISSPGGSVHSGDAIYQTIEALKASGKEVVCIADFAASMAFALLQTCSVRYVMPNSILMQHQMSSHLGGNFEQIKHFMTMMDDMNKRGEEIQSARLGLTPNEFSEKVESDWWMYGDTILKNKAADEMVNVICDQKLLKETYVHEVDTWFGPLHFTFSKCPLVRRPLNVSWDAKNELINEKLVHTYINDEVLNGKLLANMKHQATVA